MVTTHPAKYVGDTGWTSAFGSPRTTETEHWGRVTSVRVRYEDGLELELGVTSPEWASTDPVDPGTARVVRDGFRILYDPTGLLARLEAIVRPGS
jgi:hypothetical protein